MYVPQKTLKEEIRDQNPLEQTIYEMGMKNEELLERIKVLEAKIKELEGADRPEK